MQNEGRLEAVLAAGTVSQVITDGIDTHRVFETCGWPPDEAQPTSVPKLWSSGPLQPKHGGTCIYNVASYI